MRVVATELGFRGGRLIHKGTEFTLEKSEKIGGWMKKVETKKPAAKTASEN